MKLLIINLEGTYIFIYLFIYYLFIFYLFIYLFIKKLTNIRNIKLCTLKIASIKL